MATFLTVAVFSALLWILYLLFNSPFGDLDRETLAKLPRNLLELLRKAPIDKQLEFLAIIVVGGVHFWHVRRASKYERLHLDHSGIRYKSPLPDAFGSLQPDWSVQWSHVREVRIVVPKVMFHPNLAALEIDAGPVKKKLQALQWSAVDSEGKATEAGSVPWRESFFSGMGGSREMEKTLRAVEGSDIVRYARQAGVKVTTGEGSVSGFALENHRHALVATVLALFLLGYAIVDIAISQESYAVDPPFVLFALGGAIAVLVGMLWLASAGVPRAETLGLSLLLGGMVGLALYPGLLRLNEATDSEGLRDCEYRLTAYVVFSPVDSRLPVLEFDKDGQYWRQFALGTTHKFELRKGGLGFYQVNMAPVYAKLREYYTSGK